MFLAILKTIASVPLLGFILCCCSWLFLFSCSDGKNVLEVTLCILIMERQARDALNNKHMELSAAGSLSCSLFDGVLMLRKSFPLPHVPIKNFVLQVRSFVLFWLFYVFFI